MASRTLYPLPAPLSELPKYIAQHPDQHLGDIIDPYRRYEAQLRTLYAQSPEDPLLKDPYLNALPLFADGNGVPIATRARDLASESEEEKAKYIMPLPEDKRRPHGSPATVGDMAEFQHNFNIFSELSLSDMNWDNVVAAGSSVVNCLLPVPEPFKQTKRTLREYYHEKFCPASDVDLFLYGLSHDQAIEKIKQIERAIKDALLNEVTVVRTKYAITIASQYPVRHIQIVLRVYKSLSEILTGFDIDAAGGAYDGRQVYVTPRALASFITQVNHVDLTRRSPSYENRLSKYSHRNFEIYWPDLDRSRVDPTIFERNFKRTLGLARLLVLERLPTRSSRDEYLDKRRKERGRPAINRGYIFQMGGNIKDDHEDEVAEWEYEEEASSYTTFTVPYGKRYNAKRIEKLCYTRDLLLNAEWNQKDDHRKVYLHRHPAFFGRVKDVVEDCCGSCPKPTTDEEIEVAEKESKRYVSGKMDFIVDDPGRQEIGSFNPLTEQDWTDMAYVGNTARLCQSIVDGDVDEVKDWLSQDGADVDQRDHTGRTPLQLAVVSSTPEIVQCLVDSGARMISRLADGRTALHLAASRGSSDIIKILMEKSLQNEQADEERKDKQATTGKNATPIANDADESDIELLDKPDSDDDESMATESFVKIRNDEDEHKDLDGSAEDPDIFNIDVLAWDVPCSPLHLAIVAGHEDAVKMLCDYSADSILPVKFFDRYNNEQSTALLTLTLALTLPSAKAKSMAQLLCTLGATSSQAESNGTTAFHRYVASGQLDMVDTLLEADRSGVKRAINHFLITGSSWSPSTISALHTAIEQGDSILALKLLNMGAQPTIKFETWLKSAKFSLAMADSLGDLEGSKNSFRSRVQQPLLSAIYNGQPAIAMQLLESGANPNTLTTETEDLLIHEHRRPYSTGSSVLDVVNNFLDQIDEKIQTESRSKKPTEPPKGPKNTDACLSKYTPGTYQHWVVSEQIKISKKRFLKKMEEYEKNMAQAASRKDDSKEDALKDIKPAYQNLGELLKSKGAKPFAELHPDVKGPDNDQRYRPVRYRTSEEEEEKDFDWEFCFYGDQDITDARKTGYLNLTWLHSCIPTFIIYPFFHFASCFHLIHMLTRYFRMEAAWAGDVERLRALTLHPLGPNKDQAPLKISVLDSQSNNAFSLAFLRGHFEAAKVVLEIVKSQWAPQEQPKMQYKMREDAEDDEEDDEMSEDENELQIVGEKANGKTTIDDIGVVSMVVTSTTKPHMMINYQVSRFIIKEDGQAEGFDQGTLFRHCFKHDDRQGMQFLIEQAQYWISQKYDSAKVSAGDKEDEEMKESEHEDDEMQEALDEDSDAKKNKEEEEGEQPSVFRFPEADLQYGIRKGKTELLGLLIAQTGAGVPLETLVKELDLAEKKKPKYYQGLTVYGKKRSDWANAGRETVVETRSGLSYSPLRCAARSGSIESVRYFLSDKPYQLYSAFGSSSLAIRDPYIQLLNKVPDGYNRAMLKWLKSDRDSVMHDAIECSDLEKSEKLVNFLIDVCPDVLEKRSSNGYTPLMSACWNRNVEIMKILIAANVDQSVRLDTGHNILHVALSQKQDVDTLRQVLDLIDPALRAHLFQQRKRLTQGGTAPIHSWISMVCGQGGNTTYDYSSRRWHDYHGEWKDVAQILNLLLEYSNGEGLELLNGAGDTPLHTAIMYRHIVLARVLIKFKPELLYRENAVGRTPAEMAYDNLTASQLVKPNTLGLVYTGNSINHIIQRMEIPKNDHTEDLSSTNVAARLSEAGLGGEYKPEMVEKILTAAGLNENDKGLDIGSDLTERIIWDLCSTAVRNNPHHRRLVSLNEANDVARRLSEEHSIQRYCSDRPSKVEDGSEDGHPGE
ncbi:unnamed protein product [Clonostachys solani]|uniref:Ankyrin repeat protein n=1 Tax=Clonostachys solani TaxID=160281 RepID=A0A9N9Z0E4_9HYPO|nr:unnamed protein product [Clonostachys solani]